MSGITTHILNVATGFPAQDVWLQLEGTDGDGWQLLGEATTDSDGRARLLGEENLSPGDYRLTFNTGSYFTQSGIEGFYPLVQITFTVRDDRHHHHRRERRRKGR